jgi:hypothetical protein
MSIRTCVARAFCIVLATGAASAPDSAPARDADPHPGLEKRDPVATGIPTPAPATTRRGFVLDRLSKGDVRIWRAIENVVAAPNASGQPRSPTLRRIWDWARTSTHVLHVEMVSPFLQPAGIAGVFRVERIDPAGQSHVVVIRLCPRNIRYAVVGRGPNSVESFVRFEGLTDVERYAEVLAHELAHAEYFLESPERLAQLAAAQGVIRDSLSGTGRGIEPVPQDVGGRLQEPLAVLAASEAHAESVEAVVLRELAGDRAPETALGCARSAR